MMDWASALHDEEYYEYLGQMKWGPPDGPLYGNRPSQLENSVISELDIDRAERSFILRRPMRALKAKRSARILPQHLDHSLFKGSYLDIWLSSILTNEDRMSQETLYSLEKQRPLSSLGTNPYRRKPIERSFLPVIIDEKCIEALPDTNATCNVIAEQFAQSIGAHIDRSVTRQYVFTNAIGIQSRSVGETSLKVAFPDNPLKTWQCKFAVMPNCPEGLVFGDHFLRTVTETITKFRHRLKKAISTLAKRTWRLLHMQYPRQKLECFINSSPVLANADTGSDVDLVSLNYAKLRGWDIDPLPYDEGFVILSDGTIAKVSGHVDVDLFLRGTNNESKRFYVLDGLVSDVVLGDTTLDELDVFNEHIDLFVDLDELEEGEDFFIIEWVERLNKIEAEVDCLLQGTPSTEIRSPVAPLKFWDRLYHVVKRRGGRKIDQRPKDIITELRRRLQDLDSIDAQLSSLSSKKMETLVGQELRNEQENDKAREKQYCDLRGKILGCIRDLSQPR